MQPTTPPPATAATLSAFLQGPVIKHDQVLSDLLASADSLPHATLLVYDYLNKATLYIGESVLGLCGYESSAFCSGRTEFVIKLTNPQDMPYLMLLQTGYVQEAKADGFEPGSLRFHDYYWSMVSKDGTKIPIVSTGVVLTYTRENDFGIGVGFFISNDQNCDSGIITCKDLLRQIKQRHNQIYNHPDKHETTELYPLHHVSLTADSITQRERQVLGMLAQGHSTSAIADVLHIAINTVESHRKKLLLKFQAKNSAELIMKASKVFWLN